MKTKVFTLALAFLALTTPAYAQEDNSPLCSNQEGLVWNYENPLPEIDPCEGSMGSWVAVQFFDSSRDGLEYGVEGKKTFNTWQEVLDEAAQYEGGSIWFEPQPESPEGTTEEVFSETFDPNRAEEHGVEVLREDLAPVCANQSPIVWGIGQERRYLPDEDPCEGILGSWVAVQLWDDVRNGLDYGSGGKRRFTTWSSVLVEASTYHGGSVWFEPGPVRLSVWERISSLAENPPLAGASATLVILAACVPWTMLLVAAIVILRNRRRQRATTR